MAVIHELRTEKGRKKKKRIGRGGKRGAYSGRGIKGQKSRAGAKIKPQEKEAILKMPKLRGYRFKPLKKKAEVLALKVLDKEFSDGEIVSLISLKKKKLVSRDARRAKILLKGGIKKKLLIKDVEISKKAKEAILKAGGKII